MPQTCSGDFQNQTSRQLFKSLLGLFGIVTAVSCSQNHNYTMQADDLSTVNDTIPRVTGIGGIFFLSDSPKQLTEWYGHNLGLVTDEYGSPFEFRNAHDPTKVNYLRWSPFHTDSNSFAPSQKSFMINYRVKNIEQLVARLKANHVTILDNIETFEYGKFVHILDPDGNKVELWEPVDDFFTKMGGPTTK